MTFNLINDAWIPVKRMDGTKELITPWQLTDESNPIISLAAPRPDFNGALIQFLIGLVQTTMTPKNERGWKNILKNPPRQEYLKDMFGKVSPAFNLDGDGPCFMQDFDLKANASEDYEKLPIERLLAGMAGDNTIAQNRDHFIKENTVSNICYSCCATALIAVENYVNFGRGHRTPLRGANALTTIVLSDRLWETIWLNVMSQEELFSPKYGDSSKSETGSILPWMGNSFTRSKEQLVTPQEVHPYHIFWTMPYRILLDFSSKDNGNCDLCGCYNHDLITKIVRKPYGINYKGSWIHTLTPYRAKDKNQFPQKVENGGIYYRHWLGLVQEDKGHVFPAPVVISFYNRKRLFSDLNDVLKHEPRLWAFGYDSENANYKCWYEGKMPLINVEEQILSAFELEAAKILKLAEIAFYNTQRSVIKVLQESVFKGTDKINQDKLSKIDYTNTRFWSNTESSFYDILDEVHQLLLCGNSTFETEQKWLKFISKVSMGIFDDYSQASQIEVTNPKRIAKVRGELLFFNSLSNKEIQQLLEISKNGNN
jgi:CRISPR system Cascade subunit CasA